MVTSDPNPFFLFMVASDRILWSQVTAMPLPTHPKFNSSPKMMVGRGLPFFSGAGRVAKLREGMAYILEVLLP